MEVMDMPDFVDTAAKETELYGYTGRLKAGHIFSRARLEGKGKIKPTDVRVSGVDEGR